MPGAKGGLQKLLGQIEGAFRVPGAAAAKVLPFTTFGVQREPNRQEDPTITSSRLPAKTDPGDPTAAGPFASIFDLRSFGFWLRLLLGAATVGKAVTKQPTNVTGVTIHSASADATSGNGTLTWTLIGTTLKWKVQAGADGPAINVGAGGDFTLESNGGGKSIFVTVVAAGLPVGNQNDADINVSATLKAHSFPVNSAADLPSALFEIQNPDINKYYRTVGGKLNELSWDPLAKDQNISGSIIAGAETVENAAWDGAPTSYAKTRACSAKGRVWDGSGAGLGIIVGATVEANNNMTGYPCLDGEEGFGYIDQGDCVLGGNLRSVFDGASAYALARASTQTRIRLEHGAIEGADLFRLIIDHSHCELMEAGPERTGKSGLYVTNRWRANAGATSPKVVLINDVAAY